jgi:hypothetical protein
MGKRGGKKTTKMVRKIDYGCTGIGMDIRE